MGTTLDSRIATGVTSAHRTISGFSGAFVGHCFGWFRSWHCRVRLRFILLRFLCAFGWLGPPDWFRRRFHVLRDPQQCHWKRPTIGKRIMKIEVTNKFGEHIPLGQSLLRNTILGVPFFLNGILAPPSLVHVPSWLCDWIHRLRNWWSYHLPLYFQSSYSPELA